MQRRERPPPPALPPSGRGQRRPRAALAPQWSIDNHHQVRASLISLAAGPPEPPPPASPASTTAVSCFSGSSRRCKRLSTGGGRPCSPSERSTNDSLRSTQLTATSSDLLEMEWVDDDDADSLDSRRQPPLRDWVYWQRDAANLPDCWTRVFAVYKAPQLWLYRYEVATPQTLLLRLKVTRVEAGRDGARQLKLTDAAAARDVHICMLDLSSFEEWRLRIRDDVYALADEMMEQSAAETDSQLAVVTRDRRSSSTGSVISQHGGALGRALSTAVTSFKKSHSEPHGFLRHRPHRELLAAGPSDSAAPGFATAPASTDSLRHKKSGWRTVKSALSGVWKHGVDRKQLDM